MSGLIFLIGMPGCGKSYWAGKIAAATGLPATDMDTVIEAEQQASVAGLFADRGEVAFRRLEQALLLRIIATESTAIVACGGGTPCFFDNLARMKSAGVVIYLKARHATLMQRLHATAHTRPLLQHPVGLEEKLDELLTARRPFYEYADYILPVENLTYSTFEEIIPRCISQH